MEHDSSMRRLCFRIFLEWKKEIMPTPLLNNERLKYLQLVSILDVFFPSPVPRGTRGTALRVVLT